MWRAPRRVRVWARRPSEAPTSPVPMCSRRPLRPAGSQPELELRERTPRCPPAHAGQRGMALAAATATTPRAWPVRNGGAVPPVSPSPWCTAYEEASSDGSCPRPFELQRGRALCADVAGTHPYRGSRNREESVLSPVLCAFVFESNPTCIVECGSVQDRGKWATAV